MSRLAALAAAIALTISHAAAQTAPSTAPYDILLATAKPAPAGAADAFAALRSAVDASDASALGRLVASDVVAVACEADPSKPCAPGKARTVGKGGAPLDRLRRALCCDGKADRSMAAAAQNEAMFGVIGSILQGAAVGAGDSPETACVPAPLAPDRPRLAALAARLKIEATALRVATAPMTARAKPEAGAPLAFTFPAGAVVPLVGELTANVPDGWTALALPGGGVGYADAPALDELAPQALCMRRTPQGWRLAVLILRQ